MEPAQRQLSYDEYLALEQSTGMRHEFVDGEVFAMAGGTPEHDALASNVRTALAIALEGKPCAVHGPDLRLRIDAANRSTYADGVVICDARERSSADPNAVVNPRVAIEVLSPSTEAYDRGEKAALYRSIATLEAYVLVAQDRELVEVFERRDDGWHLSEARAGEALRIAPLDVSVAVDDVYRDPLGGTLVRAEEAARAGRS